MNTLVFQTGRAARIDDYAGASGPAAEFAREIGLRAGVGVPVSVEGRLWGVMFVASREEPLPAGTEARLAGFTELAATAIANAEAQAALTASRARIVATADATRRRIERNLHDGAQQRLVSLALDLRAAQAAAPPGAGDLAQQLDRMAAGLDGVLRRPARDRPRPAPGHPRRERPAPGPEDAGPPLRRPCPTSTSRSTGGCPNRSRPPPTTPSPKH